MAAPRQGGDVQDADRATGTRPAAPWPDQAGYRCPKALGFGRSETEDPSDDGVPRDSARCRTSAVHVEWTAPDSEAEHLDIDSLSAPVCR
jgi:hypothetical protein